MSAAAADAARLRAPDAGAGTTRDVVLNAAYLVADSDTVRFHALASELSQRYAAQGLSLELTGPWPPYNFVSLDLSVEARADETDEESGAPETDTCLRKTDAGPEAAA